MNKKGFIVSLQKCPVVLRGKRWILTLLQRQRLNVTDWKRQVNQKRKAWQHTTSRPIVPGSKRAEELS